MTWESAQAGNRASKTRRDLQWWDTEPELHAVTSDVHKMRDPIFFFFFFNSIFSLFIPNEKGVLILDR